LYSWGRKREGVYWWSAGTGFGAGGRKGEKYTHGEGTCGGLVGLLLKGNHASKNSYWTNVGSMALVPRPS